MKTLRMTMVMLMMSVTTMSMNAGSMSYYEMRNHARFLTDRMMYVLDLSTALMDELYCINYDYICGVNGYLDDLSMGYRFDDYNVVLLSRDRALRLLLGERVWSVLVGYDYFYRPICFVDHGWHFGVYAHDRWNRRLFFDRPRHFDDYRGGRYFGGMAEGRGVNNRISCNDNRGSFSGNRNDNMGSNRGDMTTNNNRSSYNGSSSRSSSSDNGNYSRGNTRTDVSTRGNTRTDVSTRSNTRTDVSSRGNTRTSVNSGGSSFGTRNTSSTRTSGNRGGGGRR